MKFYREFYNGFVRIAVTGKILLPGKLAPSIVKHVPRKLSRYIWYALRYCTIAIAEGKDERQKRSALLQRGLEILIKLSHVWDDAVKIKR